MNTPSKPPPRFVPTLTDIVPEAAVAPVGQTHPAAAPQDIEEQIVHRVMQRVDVALEYRLRDAIARVVHEQTRSIVPRLREEVESVVRQSVYEAVADELADNVMGGKRI